MANSLPRWVRRQDGSLHEHKYKRPLHYLGHFVTHTFTPKQSAIQTTLSSSDITLTHPQKFQQADTIRSAYNI